MLRIIPSEECGLLEELSAKREFKLERGERASFEGRYQAK